MHFKIYSFWIETILIFIWIDDTDTGDIFIGGLYFFRFNLVWVVQIIYLSPPNPIEWLKKTILKLNLFGIEYVIIITIKTKGQKVPKHVT